MVKTFIQTVETQPWLRRGRQFLASTLIFSMLAMDVAKAMEDEKDSARISHTIPPILKYTGGDKTDSLSFNNYSSDSEIDSDKFLLGLTGSSPENQKPEEQSFSTVPLIVPLPPQNLYLIPSSPLTLPTSVGLGSVDPRSLENREQPLFTVSVNYPQLSPSLIYHPLEVDSASDEEAPHLRDHHRQSNKAVSIKQHGNIIKLTLQRDSGVEDDTSLEFVDLGYSNTPPSSHCKQQDSRVKTKKLEQKPLPSSDNFIRSTGRLPSSSFSEAEQERQRLLRDLIGEEPSKSLFSDSRDIRRPNTPPIFTHNLSPKNSSQIVVVNERSSLLRSQPSIQCDDHDSDRSEDGEVSIEIGHSGNPDDPLYLAPSENRSQYKSCCGCSSKRPFCHKRTEYTLPNLEQHLDEFSRLVVLIRQGPSLHSEDEVVFSDPNSSFEIDSEGSSPLDGSPTKEIRVGGILGDDSDKESVFSDNTNSLLGFDIPQEDNRLDHLPTGSSQPQLLLIDQDVEGDGPSASQVKSFWEAFQKLPSAAKAKLKDFMHQIFDDKSTWKQRIGKWVLGPVVGAMDAIAMGTVYIASFYYISDNYSGKYVDFIDNLVGGKLAYVISIYITLSLFPDAASRNGHLWKKAIGYLSNANLEKLRLFTTAFLSIFPSCIEPIYLVEAELRGIEYNHYHGLNNPFAIYIMVFCPFLFADSFASNMNTLWTSWPSIRESLGEIQSTLSHYLCRKSIDFRPTSEEKLIRESFDKRLKNITHFFSQASNEDIEAIYSQVFQDPEHTLSNENPDVSAAQQAILAVSRLLSLGEKVIEGSRSPTSLSEKGFDIFKKICMLTGSPIRFLVLQNIFATMGSLVLSAGPSQALGWSLATIGFPVQTALEWQAMGNVYERFIRQQEPQEHASHPRVRGHVDRFSIFQGVIITLCLISATLQALNSWDLSSWWLFAAIPFLIPEFAGQAFGFTQTYNDQVATAVINGGHKIGGRCQGKSLCTSCKRDRLKGLAQKSRKELEEWTPDLRNILTIISGKSPEKPAIVEL